MMMYDPTMFSHQIPFHFPTNENAVPEHHYSSSEGSEGYAFGAPPAGDAFLSDGSADSGIGSFAATDEPYLPPRSQDAPTGNPSPLSYSVAPEQPYTHSHHSASPSHHHRNYSGGYTHQGYGNNFAPDYRQTSYASRHADIISDVPYVPPGFGPPPPLDIQTQRYFPYQHPSNAPPPPPSQPVPRPIIAPPFQQDLPLSPTSSEASDVSLGHNYEHEILAPLPVSPSQPQVHPEPHASMDPGTPQMQVSIGTEQGEFSRPPRPEPPAEEPQRSQKWYETDRYLRNQIGIPEGTSVDLWALPDPPQGQKPQQPLPILVKLAIHGSEKGMLTLQEIYQTLEDRFVYFAALKNPAWKNSIRHNLSLNQVFRSCDRPITEPGKGRYWGVDISQGEGYKRERRRKRRNAAPYNGTRDLPGGIGNQLKNQVDSSDGDQDMEDTPPAPKLLKTKKGKGTGRRGPYTRLTIGQPSVPGSTGINAPHSGTPSLSPVGGTPPAAPTPPSTSAPMGEMMYPTSMSMDPSTSSSAVPHASTSTTRNPPHAMQQDVISSAPASLPHHVTPYYQAQSSYFNRTSVPTFGQTSLPTPNAYTSMGRPSPNASYVTGARLGGNRGAISVSSDSSSSPEMSERMLGVRGGDRMNM